MHDLLSRVSESPLALTLRLLIGMPLLVGGVTKIWQPRPSALALVGFRIRRSASDAAARGVGVTEVLAGACAIVMPSVGIAALPSAFLFGLFSLLVGRAVKSGESFSCGCFGAQEEPISGSTLLRASMLFSVAILSILAPVDSDLSTGKVGSASLTYAAIVSTWVLLEMRSKNLVAWHRFVENEIDWNFAFELHVGDAPQILDTTP